MVKPWLGTPTSMWESLGSSDLPARGPSSLLPGLREEAGGAEAAEFLPRVRHGDPRPCPSSAPLLWLFGE